MNKGFFIIISDDSETLKEAQNYAFNNGLNLQSYSTSEWQQKLNDPNFVSHLSQQIPTLAIGDSFSPQAKVLPFPGANVNFSQSSPSPQNAPATVSSPFSRQSIQTMNEVESMALKKAIYECRGNLTEAAKALGIGRATLYRKVKQYNIDPGQARLRRKAS